MESPISESLYPYMIKQKDFKIVRKVLLIVEPILVLGTLLAFWVSAPLISFVFGTEYSEAASVFILLLPAVIVTFPSYIMGFPTLNALGLFKESNFIVLISSMFHCIIMFLLYLFEKLNIYSVSILTVITETVLMCLRIGVYMTRRNAKSIE